MCKACDATEAILPPPPGWLELSSGQFIFAFVPSGQIPKIAKKDSSGLELSYACSSCGGVHWDEEELVSHCSDEEDKLCDDCRLTCEHCYNVHRSDDDDIHTARDGESYSRRNAHEEIRCSECSWECDDCDEWFYGDSGTNSDGKKICYHCQENYTTCENCSDVVHNDDSIYIQQDSQCYCSSCGREREREIEREESGSDEDTESDEEEDTSSRSSRYQSSLIRPYDYKAPLSFHAMPGERTQEFYGLEIETELESIPSSGYAHDEVIRSSGIADDSTLTCKRDGSLADGGDGGFEIVSQPCSWLHWQNRDWSFLASLQSAGYSAGENCGLHIHVSRKSLSCGQIAKLLLFVKRNAGFMKCVSRRMDERLTFCKINDDDTGQLIHKAQYGNSHEERYKAINLENRNTIEFRIFQGSLDSERIKINLAFVRSLIAFVRSSSLLRLSAQDYRSFVALHCRKLLGKDLQSKLLSFMHNAHSTDLIAA